MHKKDTFKCYQKHNNLNEIIIHDIEQHLFFAKIIYQEINDLLLIYESEIKYCLWDANFFYTSNLTSKT